MVVVIVICFTSYAKLSHSNVHSLGISAITPVQPKHLDLPERLDICSVRTVEMVNFLQPMPILCVFLGL